MEQQRRLKILDNACQKLNLPRTLPNYSKQYTLHLIVDDKYKFLFNYIPKVSCTTWKGVLKKLHRSHSEGGYRRLSSYTPEEIKYRLENYRKALFVREPVTRLLSAYLSKFRNMAKLQKTWEKMYGHRIVRMYREDYAHVYINKWVQNSMEPDTFLNITLPEFIQFITDQGESIHLNEISDHFLPLSKVSTPCGIHYDFIGHFENLTTEAPYMLKFLGVDHATQYPEFHASKAVQKLIDEYEHVPLNLMKRLQNYYRNDYALFGYNFDDTLKSIVEGSFNDDDDDDEENMIEEILVEQLEGS